MVLSSKPAAAPSKEPPSLLTVVPTGAALGAEIQGLDLRDVILSPSEGEGDSESGDEATGLVAAILDAWHSHSVLLFRNQRDLSPDGLLAFSRRFGALDLAPIQETGRRFVEGRPELYVVSNVLDDRGNPIGALGHGEAAWHTDMSYLETPPKASMLHAIEVPESGGNTSFACMYSAYDSLPDGLTEKVKGLKVKHDATFNSGGLARAGLEVTDDPRRSPGFVHPLVVTHPETGRRCLYLGRRLMAWIEGYDLQSSCLLLDELWGYATADALVWTH
jgi:taurine dioxygenase